MKHDAPDPLGIRYVESSALIAAILENDQAAGESLRASGHRVTSTLTLAEAHRVVLRAHHSGRLRNREHKTALAELHAFFEETDLVPVSVPLLLRAGRRFAVEPIRALDAIHLATIELVADDARRAVVITRDQRVRENALALGCLVE